MKVCKICGSPNLVYNSRLCVECDKKRRREYQRRNYILYGKQKRLNNKVTCSICGNKFTQWRKNNFICPTCRKEMNNTGYKDNQYTKAPKSSKDLHRVIAEQLLKRKLTPNEIVHHVDLNILNNSLSNLWIMSRHLHGKLHAYLRIQRVIYEKSLDKHAVNCWNSLIVVQTTAWLEMTNANVIKLNELANQQPSTLNGEGSETRDGKPKL